jgi:hypothetical protein
MARFVAVLRICAVFLFISGSVLLSGCAADGGASQGDGSAEHGYCQGNTCTGVCQDEVLQFAKNTLGSEAMDIYFDWDAPSGGVGMSGGTVYFTTAACTSGKYQLEFFGNPQTCSNTFYGRPPKYVGKLLVVPQGCAGTT